MTNIVEKQDTVWKTYPELPFVEANQYGEIRITDRVITLKDGRKRLVKGHVLKQYLQPNGYKRVSFSINGKTVDLLVHRVIASAFIPNPNNYPEVDHIDCNPANNNVNNLRWVTHQKNIAHRDKLGRTAKYNAPKKPVIAVNLETLEVLYFKSQREAERQLDIDNRRISDVVKGKLNKTRDYWFCRADGNAVERVRAKFGDKVVNKVKKLISDNL